MPWFELLYIYLLMMQFQLPYTNICVNHLLYRCFELPPASPHCDLSFFLYLYLYLHHLYSLCRSFPLFFCNLFTVRSTFSLTTHSKNCYTWVGSRFSNIYALSFNSQLIFFWVSVNIHCFTWKLQASVYICILRTSKCISYLPPHLWDAAT